jgi:ligand-binding sensor domain-containing protein/two-component sensor histidine kinase
MKKFSCLIALASITPFLCILLIIFFSITLQAQEMSMRIYNIKDGLPATYVHSVYQDKLGYLWIGSVEGFSRFDGKNFINYDLSDGLPDIRVSGGFSDSYSNFWAATPRGIVNFKGNKFVTYPISDSRDIRWTFGNFETRQHKIWGLTDAGVYEFTNNSWQKIKLYPGYENHVCRGIIESKEGLLINYGDLLVLKKTNDTYKVIGTSKKSGYFYNFLYKSELGNFIATTEGVYNIVNDQLFKLPGLLGDLKGLYTLCIDIKKRIWIASYEMGLVLLQNLSDKKFKSIYKSSSNFLIQDIIEDRDGNIWAASQVGLIKIAEKGFRIFNTKLIFKEGLNRIFNVLQPPNSTLILNNGSTTLYTFKNGVTGYKKLVYKDQPSSPDGELIIDNYAFDDKGRNWFYVRGFALVMQKGNEIFEQSKPLAHLGKEVFDILFDQYRKKIIVAVGTQKFPCVFNDTGYCKMAIINKIDVEGEIIKLHQCVNGTVLFATSSGNIYSIDKENKCRLQLNEFGTNGIIGKILNNSNGDVWIIYSGRGLRRYSWQKENLVFKEEITKNSGLPSNNTTSLCFDNNKNLWVCTNSNVTVFSKESGKEQNETYKLSAFFDSEDLQLNDAVDTKLIKDSSGNIWCFTGTHLICFYPGNIQYTQSIPNIQIETIDLNLKETNWAKYADSSSSEIFRLPKHLKLSHSDNTLGIYFKGISSSGTEGIKYSYQLIGLDTSWSPPSYKDFVSLIKLPPGKYVFKVKAQLPNTKWSLPSEFEFEIKKAWWQTWWFYMLVSIVLSSAIYTLFRYLLQQKINLLEMRNRFSQDLHDEIGSSVSGINLLSQMAAEKLNSNRTEEASAYLTKVNNYSQDVIEKLSDMVWVFNPQNDSIEKLLQRLKSFAVSIALSKNITLHFETDKESEIKNLTIRQRKAIYLISKEALNNIFKYATCNNIYYNLVANGAKWKLQIKDDGIGFLSSEITKGNGLGNMLARAKEIRGKINIQSQPGKGTIVTLEF